MALCVGAVTALTSSQQRSSGGTEKAAAAAGDYDPVGEAADPGFPEALGHPQSVSIGPVIGPIQNGRFRHP